MQERESLRSTAAASFDYGAYFRALVSRVF
jgi:hypothetical protein